VGATLSSAPPALVTLALLLSSSTSCRCSWASAAPCSMPPALPPSTVPSELWLGSEPALTGTAVPVVTTAGAVPCCTAQSVLLMLSAPTWCIASVSPPTAPDPAGCALLLPGTTSERCSSMAWCLGLVEL
jgi:hypothetical protein